MIQKPKNVKNQSLFKKKVSNNDIKSDTFFQFKEP
jgi:hypothetical protein